MAVAELLLPGMGLARCLRHDELRAAECRLQRLECLEDLLIAKDERIERLEVEFRRSNQSSMMPGLRRNARQGPAQL